MPWTDENLVNDYLPSVDLALEPGAFDNAITVSERDMKARLLVLISDATIATWTTVANTPEIVVSWTTEMAAAYYLSEMESYHLQPEIPDNPAAIIYDRILKQIESAKYAGMIILDVTGAIVPITGATTTADTRWTEYLPYSQGGEYSDA